MYVLYTVIYFSYIYIYIYKYAYMYIFYFPTLTKYNKEGSVMRHVQ